MKRTLALVASTALAAALMGAPAASGLTVMLDTQITANASNQQDVSIWGDKMVYEDTRDGGGDDVYLYDLSTGAESRITTDGADAWEPVIYGDKIVWNDNRDGGPNVHMYDLSTGTETAITNSSYPQGDARLHGTNVVWGDKRNTADYDVWRYNLVDGTESLVAGGPNDQDYPDVFGERIVYENYDTPTFKADIHMRDLVTGAITKITDEEADPKWNIDDYDPRIWGDKVVWYDQPTIDAENVRAYDLATSAHSAITSGAVINNNYPTVFKNRVVWTEESGANDVKHIDLSSGARYTVAGLEHDQQLPDVWGNKVVWEDARAAQFDIWMNTIPIVPDRAGGNTRYDTAAIASSNHFANASTVVVATGAGFADALAASGLAGCYGGPLILTSPNSLSPAAATEITRLGAQNAIIVGGTGAVSNAVRDDLLALGLGVERLGGATRYETAVKIADRIFGITGSNFEKTAFIARGDSFPDALAVSPLAYYNRFPILLTRPNALPATTQGALTSLDIETAVIAGGIGAVSNTTQLAIDGLLASNGGAPSERWAGATRYETAVKVAEEACDKYWAGRGFVGVAVGSNFPDALAGGAAVGREFGVLLLVRPDSLPPAAADFVTDSGAGIGWVEAFGGTGAVSDAVMADIAQIIN